MATTSVHEYLAGTSATTVCIGSGDVMRLHDEGVIVARDGTDRVLSKASRLAELALVPETAPQRIELTDSLSSSPCDLQRSLTNALLARLFPTRYQPLLLDAPNTNLRGIHMHRIHGGDLS